MSGRFTYRRVVIGQGVAPGGERSVDIAARLAGIARAQLKGLFVEETALFDLADLPFSKTLAAGGRGFKNLDRGELQKAFAGQAAAFRSRLSLHAQRAQIAWEFAETKGDVVAALAAECQSGDIVVLSGMSAGVTAPDLVAIARRISANVAGVVIAAETPASLQSPVVVIDQDGDRAAQLRTFAEDMASHAGRRLVVLSMNAEAPAAQLPSGGQVWHLREADASAIAAALRRLRPWCVIADLSGALFKDDQSARMLISASAAPVLLMHGP